MSDPFVLHLHADATTDRRGEVTAVTATCGAVDRRLHTTVLAHLVTCSACRDTTPTETSNGATGGHPVDCPCRTLAGR